MSNIPISSLPLAISLDGSEEVPIVQGGTTKRTTTSAISNFPALTEAFVIVGTSTALPDARTIAVQTGPLSLTDGGAGSNVTIGIDASNTLDLIGSTQGQILYRGASGWSALSAGTAGQTLTTNGAGANPSWASVASGLVAGTGITITGTSPATISLTVPVLANLGGTGFTSYALGDLLYADTTSTLAKLAGNTSASIKYLAQTGTGSASAAPAWTTISGGDITGAALTKVDDTNVTLTLGGSPTTALLRAASITAGWTGQLSLARGGTNANLTASNGGIFYSTASAGAILAGTATAGQMLRSGSSAAPSWSTATWPATTTSQQILYSSAANTVGGLAAANGGVPWWNNSTGALTATANPTLGVNGAYIGTLALSGNTSGTVTITPQAAAGTATFTLPNASGTPAISVPSPLSLSTTTGAVTWSGLTSGGVLYASSTTAVASSALLTANALVLGGGAGAAPATLASLGTTTTVLHGNAAGAPTFGAVSLTADVSGTLPVANGGTGLSSGTSGGILGFTASGTIASSAALTANALVLGGGAGATPTALGSLGTTTTVLHGNAAGAPTFGAVSLTADVSGTLPVANGGTNITSGTDTATTVIGRTVGSGTSGSTNDSSSGSGAYVAMTPSVSIPANFITTGRMLRVTVLLRLTTTTPGAFDYRLSLGGTSVAQVGPITPASGLSAKTVAISFATVGLAAPSASSNTETAVLTTSANAIAAATVFNSITQPVALATNGSLTLQVYTQWETAGTGTNTATLQAIIVEAVN